MPPECPVCKSQLHAKYDKYGCLQLYCSYCGYDTTPIYATHEI